MFDTVGPKFIEESVPSSKFWFNCSHNDDSHLFPTLLQYNYQAVSNGAYKIVRIYPAVVFPSDLFAVFHGCTMIFSDNPVYSLHHSFCNPTCSHFLNYQYNFRLGNQGLRIWEISTKLFQLKQGMISAAAEVRTVLKWFKYHSLLLELAWEMNSNIQTYQYPALEKVMSIIKTYLLV